MAAISVIAGETVRITARDLTHSDEGPVTTGAAVTVDLYELDGTLASSNAATADDDDWSYDLTAPAVPGQYEVKISAVVSGATARDKLLLTVKPW